MQPDDVRAPADVVALAKQLLGADPARAGRVLQTVSVWRDPRGAAHVLRSGPRTPRSRSDSFLLALGRARAEAIVTTGKILRDEPGVTHAVFGAPAMRAALLAWRRERLVLALDPWLLVLSSGRGLDPAHPAFHAPLRPILFVPAAAATGLRERFAETDVRVVAPPAPSLGAALDHLRRLGARHITVEAGPTSTRGLYEDPVGIDELWLSTYAGSPPDPEVIGEPFADDAALVAALPGASTAVERDEASGPWRFERRWR